MRAVDWTKVVDLGSAVANVRTEFVGDWHRDPWAWPELGFVTKEPAHLSDNLNARGARRAALIDVPKENWGSRPAVILDILDRLTYQSLVDRLSIDLIGNLHPSVYGWRLAPGETKPGTYSHNNLQWDGYRRHLAFASTFFDAALVTDIVSCFASMPIDAVRSQVEDRAPKTVVSTRLFSILEGFDQIPERSGLPQRSLASAVLANMTLAPLDDLLDHFAVDVPALSIIELKGGRPKTRRRRSWSRWMDDMWLFGNDPALMRTAQRELQDAARSIGLNINSGKTEVLEGADVAERAMQIEHSAVDSALDTKKDHGPLEELIDRLLEHPEVAGRTSLRFAVTRMREHGSSYKAQELVHAAPRMPHAADTLAPLFKGIFKRESLQDWFLDYASGSWASYQWSVAHYARMFPSRTKPRNAMRQFMVDRVDDAGTSLPLLAVAAERLATWDPPEYRAVARAALKQTSHPQSRRVLALAALNAGETRRTVAAWLRQEPENQLTLKMLEAQNFATPKVGPDFQG